MARTWIVPGLAVRDYVLPAAWALASHGVDVELLPAPGGPDAPGDVAAYGERLASRLRAAGPVDLLVGLSVGAQAAAVAAAGCPGLARLVLVSPTVDPSARSLPVLLARWLADSRREPPRLALQQLPDWRRAGPVRLRAAVRSATRLALEEILPRVEAALIVVHAERDPVTSHSWAAELATDHGGRLVVVPGATHSWPYADPARFADLAAGLLR